MATRSSAARLRRTFRYPADTPSSDSDSSPSAMDEQEQESYIRRLADRNRAQNLQTSHLLLAVPLLAAVPHLLALAASPPPSALALSSLAATAYLLLRLPPPVTGLRPLDRRRAGATGAGAGGAAAAAPRGPLDTALPYLNALLAALLAFWGAAAAYKARRLDGPEVGGALAWPVMCNLPLAVYAVVLLAKVVMAGVDPEKDLSALRYDYKGA